MLDSRVRNFLDSHHVLTLATCVDNEPYCCSTFYACMEGYNQLVITSSTQTRHVEDIAKNSRVAGSIVLETKIIGKIQGIQFCGTIAKPTEEQLSHAKKTYYKRFPYAAFMDSELWIIDLDFVKMTDNRLGFGKKIIWQREK